MKIQLRARNVELSEILRAHVDRRLSLALGRFAERIDKVVVQFMPAIGRDLVIQKRCRIEVGLRPRPVTVEDTDADLFAAVDRATDRLARSVARALEREQVIAAVVTPTTAGTKA